MNLASLSEKSFTGILQVVGFLVILSGSSLYNELIRVCLPNTAVTDETAEAEVSISKFAL